MVLSDIKGLHSYILNASSPTSKMIMNTKIPKIDPEGPFFWGSRWKFENRYGGATINYPKYSQPKH